MKFLMLAAIAVLGLSVPAFAMGGTTGEVGKPAPDFSAKDTMGADVKLSDFNGKIVVLEWTNHECPYVRKQYDSGNMQKLQQEAAADGVVWISVVSSAPGKEGNTTPAEANAIIEQQEAHPTHKILDSDGTIGHMYGAKTTPHMFVIDKAGTLVYAGAIDDDSSFKPDSIATAKNYVRAVLEDLKAGRSVAEPSTQPYGCGVKY